MDHGGATFRGKKHLGELEQELRSIVVMQERPDRFRPIRTKRLLLHSCLVKQPGSPPRVAGYYTF